jgi:NAD(P)-dependent dehydrogenase (short-subunit alcohol dehydrogenase family)
MKNEMNAEAPTTKKAGHTPANLQGKNIIITGGTTGIGRATAMLLASQGANILILGRHEQVLADALHSMDSASLQGTVHGIIADVSREEGIAHIFSEADSRFRGGPDILVNNAAIAWQGIMDGDYSDWQYVINTNLLGYMACVRQAVDRMRVRGEGHIINIGSMSADVREQDSSVYVATKAAIQGFSEALRKEVNELGIKVTLIEPGAVGTDMQPASPEEQRQKIIDMEMLRAEDIAAAVLYCLSQSPRCDVLDIKIRPHMQLI